MAKWLLLVIVRMYGDEKSFLTTKQVEKQIVQNQNTIGMLSFLCCIISKMRLETFLPYKVIEIETAEADDIIATLVRKITKVRTGPNHAKKVLILSGDKDFHTVHNKICSTI